MPKTHKAYGLCQDIIHPSKGVRVNVKTRNVSRTAKRLALRGVGRKESGFDPTREDAGKSVLERSLPRRVIYDRKKPAASLIIHPSGIWVPKREPVRGYRPSDVPKEVRRKQTQDWRERQAHLTPVRVQKTTTSSGGTTVVTDNFGSSCTAGNYVIVVIRNDSSLPTAGGVTDTLGTSYSNAVNCTGAAVQLAIWYGKLSSSGTNAASAVVASDNGFAWVQAIEVSGLAASSPFDTSQVANLVNATSTDFTCGTFSTAQAVEYVILAVSDNAGASYTAGADFSLITGNLQGGGFNLGGTEDYITSSALTTYTAHITASSYIGAAYSTIVASFKAAAAAGDTQEWLGCLPREQSRSGRMIAY